MAQTQDGCCAWSIKVGVLGSFMCSFNTSVLCHWLSGHKICTAGKAGDGYFVAALTASIETAVMS